MTKFEAISDEQVWAKEAIIKYFGQNPDANASWNEIEKIDGGVRIWLADPTAEIPPSYHTELTSALGAAGLGEVPITYIYSQSAPELQ